MRIFATGGIREGSWDGCEYFRGSTVRVGMAAQHPAMANDGSMSSEEMRRWRTEELASIQEERDFRARELQWRNEDIQQRHLENARWIWYKYVEKNRRDVEEKAEQLKAISSLSALIAGFAVVALVELEFEPEDNPETLIALYAVSTAITVALMTNAMVTCSLMLAAILKNGKLYVSSEEETEFMIRCKKFATTHRRGDGPPVPKRTFQLFWASRCEGDWKTAFRFFSMGVPSFMINVVFASWLKFEYSLVTCATVTGVMGVSLLVWLFHHYSWAPYLVNRGKYGLSAALDANTVDGLYSGLPFDWHAPPNGVFQTESHARTEAGTWRKSRDPRFMESKWIDTGNAQGMEEDIAGESPADNKGEMVD